MVRVNLRRCAVDGRWTRCCFTLFAWVLAAALLSVTVMGGCERKKRYSQATPDDVIESAVAMIKDGQSRQLGNLIYAESPEMRSMLDRLGILLGNMQSLARAVEQRFPEEMAALRDKTAQAAADGSALSLLDQLGGGNRGASGGKRSVTISNRGVNVGGGGGGPNLDESQMEELFNRLFADPYGWIERNAARLSTTKVADDLAMVLLDGEPIIPGLGLPMRKEGDKWYLAMPTNVPGVSNVWPRTKQQWSILSSVVVVLDKTVRDMERDVIAGQTATLSSLGIEARKKVIIPGALAFAAYGKEIDVRMRIDRRLKQLQTRQKEWAAKKTEAGYQVPGGLFAAMNSLAAAEIELMVRDNKAPNIEQMPQGEFETMVSDWFARAGLMVRLDGDLNPDLVGPELKRWEEARRQAVLKSRK